MYQVNSYYRNEKAFFDNESKGMIGYLRGDFGSSGTEFYSTFFDRNTHLKVQEFKDELDEVVNELREGILKDKESKRKAMTKNQQCKLGGGLNKSYGMHIETDNYEYAIRLIGGRGDYDFYIMCYDKNYQEPQYKNAMRFRDSDGKLNQFTNYIAKVTRDEGLRYYTEGDRYECNRKIYTFNKTKDGMCFESRDGEKIYIDPQDIGTFLPDVASDGVAFTKLEADEVLNQLTLGDLLKGVTLSSTHLVHKDEDIDLSTIEDLSNNTLTEAGKAHWHDVLNARVTQIYEGNYGLQIECDDVEPDRLAEFSHTLAGYVDSDLYGVWVNDEPNDDQTFEM